MSNSIHVFDVLMKRDRALTAVCKGTIVVVITEKAIAEEKERGGERENEEIVDAYNHKRYFFRRGNPLIYVAMDG